AAIRQKVYPADELANAPTTFKSTDYRGKEFLEHKYTLQVAPEDCTGCRLCVEVCPAKSKTDPSRKAINMEPQPPLRMTERENYTFFLNLPEMDRGKIKINTIKGSQFLQPLFEYSGACAGCGETPYVKLLSQLFGDRAIMGNATGCSSIYGGNLPTTPWCVNADGRGPTWNNSLFEYTAEFSFGFRLTIDKHRQYATELLKKLAGSIGDELAGGLLEADQTTEAGIIAQRQRVQALKEKLNHIDSADARHLLSVADFFVRKSVWGVGGDGWAYDIGYGGLDHVLAQGRDVNLLTLDTGVYSNTGGQCSKATPMGAVAKFAAGGKPTTRKDLGLMAMSYGNVYVAQIAMGANDLQTLKAFIEAESYPGPSLIIAYSHCIAHGIDMSKGMESQKATVDSGAWLLYRYDPRRALKGLNPLQLDSKPPKIPVEQWMYMETRFKMLTKSKPAEAKRLLDLAQRNAQARWRFYEQLAQIKYDIENETIVEKPAPVAEGATP
ncbi:4Fe-4S binding protein, partial [bacterium]|nr:4Fe-4S binding protein [bacterium]